MKTTVRTGQKPPAASDAALSPDRLLADDHRRLDRTFEAIVARAQGGDPIRLRQEWDTFERELLRHLDLEEREILPRFARDDAAAARAILDDHAGIRRALLEVGISLDLHLARAEMVADLVDRIRSHARREEATLYGWAARAPREVWQAVADGLGRT